jgi:general secretion pathway protein H
MDSRNSRVPQGGFTLIEIIVVILIIGIIVSFASLSVGRHANTVAEQEAKRIQSLLNLAAEESILKGQLYALKLNQAQYSFQVLEDDWTEIASTKIYRERKIPEGLKLELQVDGEPVNLADKENQARIIILPSGEMVPAFHLSLKTEEGETYTLVGDEYGQICFVGPKDSLDEACGQT